MLYTKVYDNQGETFYVGCSWKRKKVNLESCGLEHAFPKKMMKRAKRIEAEHIIPSSWLYKVNGKLRQCAIEAKRLQRSKRKYCRRHDDNFKRAHNDLVNLRVAVGALNAERSNKPFSSVVSGKKIHTYKGNGKKLIITSRVAIPDPSIRGDIARIGFYMRDTYGVRYSKRQQSEFDKWNKEDPVSEVERRLNQKIIQVQGWGNSYIR